MESQTLYRILVTAITFYSVVQLHAGLLLVAVTQWDHRLPAWRRLFLPLAGAAHHHTAEPQLALLHNGRKYIPVRIGCASQLELDDGFDEPHEVIVAGEVADPLAHFARLGTCRVLTGKAFIAVDWLAAAGTVVGRFGVQADQLHAVGLLHREEHLFFHWLMENVFYWRAYPAEPIR